MERNITARDIMSVEAFENAATMVYVCCYVLVVLLNISSTDQNMKILHMFESLGLGSHFHFIRVCILMV